MLFIDSDHSYEGVMTDITCWEPFVEAGSLIVFDDSTDPEIGPWHIIKKLPSTRRFELLVRVDIITFLRKLQSDPETYPRPGD
jgi:hypothetical protein